MFIKSQDRNLVVNADFMYVPDEENFKTQVVAIKGDRRIILGEYCCNDRAKEVLDTICDAIEDGMEIIEHDDKSEQSISRHSIFDMPNK